MGFNGDSITDQKRLVRGEHWLAARSYLRYKSHAHHDAWKVLTIAGPAPAGEIGCILELMPRAHITAVDLDQARVDAASKAGAHKAILCNIAPVVVVNRPGPSSYPVKEWKIPDLGRFDAICLDLTGHADDLLRRTIRLYSAKTKVLIVTFSYGRDVVEFYVHNALKHPTESFEADGIHPSLSARIGYLCGSLGNKIRSVMVYRGPQQPMVSILMHEGVGRSFVKVQDGDFELAVTHPDVSKLYDCPSDRILHIRRSLAARKAVATKNANAKKEQP